MRILITGGAGYIGSHTLLALLLAGHKVCVLDNYANSSPEALVRVGRLTNRPFEEATSDIRDGVALQGVCTNFKPEVVIHFAGLKSVAESQSRPLDYYEQNIFGTVQLLKAMDEVACRRIIFSSSATVYGEPQFLPFTEDHPCVPVNTYGWSKYFVERIIRDWTATQADKSAVLLRYFNPVGAHPSGQIGEDPTGTLNNLVPVIGQVSVGRREKLTIFGADYDTPDGTGIRDYIHVDDVARGHLSALDYVVAHKGSDAINLGTGKGVSVLEMVKVFEEVSNRKIPYEIKPRRAGDIACFFADPSKANERLSWRAELDHKQMCRDAWNWQSQNPDGYMG